MDGEAGLEAYTSATALTRQVREATGKELGLEAIFTGAACPFGWRPLCTGRYAPGTTSLIHKENCFGKEKGQLPEIELAALGKKAGIIGAASLL